MLFVNFLVYSGFLIAATLYIFCQGFFLHRSTSFQNSSCSQLSKWKENFKRHSSLDVDICGSSRFRRVIILLVDALKYDFVASYPTKNESWTNKLPIVQQLLNSSSRDSVLFRAVADSPTTTLQRLSAILTGTMPTFIDAALNFYQTTLIEDNLVRQMHLHNKKVVFMGDDTWTSLFEDVFHRSYPYPSFVVKDLDTVDDGILSHIYDEMEHSDWDVLIAHFLGVDHCGHWLGMEHTEMARKLGQINDIIVNVTSRLGEDDLLVVMGDHGMTTSGDHGGATSDETDAGLFFTASKGRLLKREASNYRSVSQIDVVPTLALLMGIPIPYSNLGVLIEDFFFSDNGDALNITPLFANLLQINKIASDLGIAHSNDSIEALMEHKQGSIEPHGLVNSVLTYLRDVQHGARVVYTRFDTRLMAFGIIVMAGVAIFMCFPFSFSPVTTFILAFYFVSPFSNSFIIGEGDVAAFLMQSVLLCKLGCILQHQSVPPPPHKFTSSFAATITGAGIGKIGRTKNNSSSMFNASVVFWKNSGDICRIGTAMVIVRMMTTMWRCRYGWNRSCVQVDDAFGWSVMCTLVSCWVICFLLPRQQRDRVNDGIVAIVRFIVVASSLMMSAYWLVVARLREFPHRRQMVGVRHEYWPNICVTINAVSLAVVCRLHRPYAPWIKGAFQPNSLIRWRDFRVDLGWLTRWGGDICSTLVATALLSTYVPASHVVSLYAIAILTQIYASCFSINCPTFDVDAVFWVLLMELGFYASGHHKTFATITWKSGFVGVVCNEPGLVLPGIRVYLSTYAANMLVWFVLVRRHAIRTCFLQRVSALYLIRLTIACTVCYYHREHLMLWEIFAPRLLFIIVELPGVLVASAMGFFSSYLTLGRNNNQRSL